MSKWFQIGSKIVAWRILKPPDRSGPLIAHSRDNFGQHFESHLGAHGRQNSLQNSPTSGQSTGGSQLPPMNDLDDDIPF